MARSFLFAQDQADAQTTRLITTAAAFTGFMKGEPGAPRPGWYAAGADNGPVLAQLRTHLAQTYPGAGAPFRAVRLWTSLIWQPAYLAVIAVHEHGAVPVLAGISQRLRGIYIDGYRLQPGPFRSGSVEAMIADAAGQLGTLAASMLEEVNRHERLKPLPARRLLADRMLGLMVRVAQKRRALEAGAIHGWSEQWLAAMGLDGHGSLEDVALPDGRLVPIVRRKGCCLDYLITPDRLCATCPRQGNAERIARQLAEWVEG